MSSKFKIIVVMIIWGSIGVFGVVYTRLVYQMYFPSDKDLTSTTVALYSYLDPVFAIL